MFLGIPFQKEGELGGWGFRLGEGGRERNRFTPGDEEKINLYYQASAFL